jgi:hypothetical protein
MDIVSASANAALEFRARAVSSTFPAGAGKRLTAIATIGGNASVSYADADVGYAVTITADDAGDVATLDLVTGDRTQDEGSPVFDPATAVDFSAVELPGMDKVFAIRITAAENDGQVSIIPFFGSGLTSALLMESGQTYLFQYPSVGVAITDETLSFSFDTAGDSVTVEIIARATPA